MSVKGTLDLLICLAVMFYPRCSGLRESDLTHARVIVKGKLNNSELSVTFSLRNDTWIEALAESKRSNELNKVRGAFAELEDEDAWKNGLRTLEKKPKKSLDGI